MSLPLAIIFAIWTKQVIPSLFIGLWLESLLYIALLSITSALNFPSMKALMQEHQIKKLMKNLPKALIMLSSSQKKLPMEKKMKTKLKQQRTKWVWR
ncbi:hypothetical protein COD11_22385 [Bacillus sp. AFS040349]|nr:hypothetical protein COD11_22385 [Bacillus sp. AFS040349]